MEDGFKLAQHTQKKGNKIKTFTTRQRQPTLSAVFIASTQLSVSRFSQFTDGPVSEGRLTLLYAFLTAIFDKIPLQIWFVPTIDVFLTHSALPPTPWFGYYVKWLNGFVGCVCLVKNIKKKQKTDAKRWGKTTRGDIDCFFRAGVLFVCVCLQPTRPSYFPYPSCCFLRSVTSLFGVGFLPRVCCHQPAEADSPQSVQFARPCRLTLVATLLPLALIQPFLIRQVLSSSVCVCVGKE